MLVCSCHGITEKKIGELVERGVQTAAELTRACGAGNDCGMCLLKLEKIFSERTLPQSESRSGSPDSKVAK